LQNREHMLEWLWIWKYRYVL